MGNRITLTNDQACSHNYLEVLWNDDAKLDLDLFALLLDRDDKLIESGDLVFYNSENRTAPFDPKIWRNQSSWRNSTLPTSMDGSVSGIDEPLDEDDGNYCGEGMFIDLFKTRPDINKILFFLAVYDDTGSRSLHGIKTIKVRLKQHESSDTIFCSDISEGFRDGKIITVCSLHRLSDGFWSVGEEVIEYNDIHAFLNKHIPGIREIDEEGNCNSYNHNMSQNNHYIDLTHEQVLESRKKNGVNILTPPQKE